MGWKIVPFESIGPIRLNQSRGVVRQILGRDFETFHKGASSIATDAYDCLGVHLYYDRHDLLEFVESFAPSSPEFANVKLLGRSIGDVDDDLEEFGVKAIRFDVGFAYHQIGIALTVNGETVEGVAVFRRGYYD